MKQLSIPGAVRFQPQAWLRGDERLRQAMRAQRKARARQAMDRADEHLGEVHDQLEQARKRHKDLEEQLRHSAMHILRLEGAETALRHTGAKLPAERGETNHAGPPRVIVP